MRNIRCIFSTVIFSMLLFSCQHDADRSFTETYIRYKAFQEYQYNQELKNYDRTIPDTITVYNRELHTELNETTEKKYLLLMYLAGDSNYIQTQLLNNMISVSKGMALSSADIKTVAFFDGSAGYTILGSESGLFEIKPNYHCTDSTIANDYKITKNLPDWIASGEVDSGSYETLGNFLSWAEENYNSDSSRRTILVIGSHGVGTSGTEINVSSSLGTSYSFCPDFTSNTIIHTNEIPMAFEMAGFDASNKIDLLMYDVCLCGTIEEAYEVRNYAKAILFSPNEIPGAGFPYQKTIANINAGSSIFSIGENLAKEYASIYKNWKASDGSRPATITFADLTLVDGIESEVSALADYFVNNTQYSYILNDNSYNYLRYNNTKITSNNINYECSYFISQDNVSNFYSFDLGYLCDKVQSFAEKENLPELTEICTNIKSRLEKIVACSWRGNTSAGTYTDFNDSTNYYGLTIVGNSALKNSQYYNPYAKTTFAFNTDTTWKNLLQLLYPKEF